jgi:dienelactone hydrolase
METEVKIPAGKVTLDGNLTASGGAGGIVLFVHGSGSSRHSPRNRFVARTLHDAGLATLLFDLLTPEEEALDMRTGHLRFDIGLLAERLVFATDWVLQKPDLTELRIGYFGSSTGGAAALVASIKRPEKIGAIVCRGSRTDMASAVLARVTAPTLLIVGERDDVVLQWNRESFAELICEKKIETIPGATHLFEEPGSLGQVAQLAARWFQQHLNK